MDALKKSVRNARRVLRGTQKAYELACLTSSQRDAAQCLDGWVEAYAEALAIPGIERVDLVRVRGAVEGALRDAEQLLRVSDNNS